MGAKGSGRITRVKDFKYADNLIYKYKWAKSNTLIWEFETFKETLIFQNYAINKFKKYHCLMRGKKVFKIKKENLRSSNLLKRIY